MGDRDPRAGRPDVMIVTNARAKPLDPSLPQGYGVVPTGAKVGIDATIPEGIPREHYERITYAYADRAKIDDYVKGKADAPGEAGDEARGGGARRRNPRRHRQGAALLHRHRGAVRAATISAPSRARSAICTRPKSCGRTRAAACACAARSSRRNRRANSIALTDRRGAPI